MCKCDNCNCSGDNGASFFAGALMGGLVGAALALVFAPQEGKKTRKWIKSEGEKLVDKAGDKFEVIKKERIDPMMEDVREEMEEKFDEVKKEVNKKIDSIKKKK